MYHGRSSNPSLEKKNWYSVYIEINLSSQWIQMFWLTSHYTEHITGLDFLWNNFFYIKLGKNVTWAFYECYIRLSGFFFLVGSSNNVIYGTEPSSGSGPIVRPFLTHLAGPPGDAGNHLTWTWKPRARLTNNCTADTQHHTLPPLPLCSLTPIKFKTNCVMIDLLFSNHACTTYCCHGPAPRELIVCRSCSRQK